MLEHVRLDSCREKGHMSAALKIMSAGKRRVAAKLLKASSNSISKKREPAIVHRRGSSEGSEGAYSSLNE